VKIWQEEVMIPTYGTGEPEKMPMFFEKRVYQGSSGVVYPYPIIEKIGDEKQDQSYKGLFLENAYLKVMVLPELGGRVQMAYEKINKRHFVYYNQVIKPALVGLLGPWISGGIEFNWPQHHRPSTYLPVDYQLEEHKDGSKTIWVSEEERMFHTKGMAGFRLYPDKAYLEIQVKLFNRTPLPQTFLWWANPAISVHDDYQSVFPPDVHAVFDHGKRDVSSFPVATGTYYKMDYSAGVDISRYKNIPVPTSYMAIRSDYDFVGGYDHKAGAGLLHVANHHVSPGKKQWTWGCGDFGKAWDRNLTDEDGPYIELMTGVYTDNQPDFSWLQPYEEKAFTQYFMPYSAVGQVKNATKDVVMRLDLKDELVETVVYVSSPMKNLHILLLGRGKLLWSRITDLHPSAPLEVEIQVDSSLKEDELLLQVRSDNGSELLSYRPEKMTPEVPQAAKAPLPPEKVSSNEDLFLTGQHLEQYRHATADPTAYYREALHRDPGDVRSNNAMGLWLLRRGRIEESTAYFEQSIATLTQLNLNPYDGEPYYNLGLARKYLGQQDQAYEALYKAVWNAAWQDAGYFVLAQLDAGRGDYVMALKHVELSLNRNSVNHRARLLKAVLLRMIGRPDDALAWIKESISLDRFNFGLYYEKVLLAEFKKDAPHARALLSDMMVLMRGSLQNYLGLALEYAGASFFEEAHTILKLLISDATQDDPILLYYAGYFLVMAGFSKQADGCFLRASECLPDFAFPNRLEAIPVLEMAMERNPGDALAPYCLGNLWYDKRQYEKAIECWERSRDLQEGFAPVHRNLALAYFNKRKDPQKALLSMERAFALSRQDARLLLELDQLRKKMGVKASRRLTWLEDHPGLVDARDDLYLERITLLNQEGQHGKARDLLEIRKFHPWEGGEGKVSGQHVMCRVELARQELMAGKGEAALEWLEQARSYPDNLGEGKLPGSPENHLDFWTGLAYQHMDQPERAWEHFHKATSGRQEPGMAMFYNDSEPDQILYQALARRKLRKVEEADGLLEGLISYGKRHLDATVQIDYFAVSLPDMLIFDEDLDRKNRAHCHYLMGLGCLGLKRIQEAHTHFHEALGVDPGHQKAALYLRNLENLNRLID